MSARLWEIEHSYHAAESNYYSNKHTERYVDWDDFVDSEGRNDPDPNCLFRWDWLRPDPDDYGPGDDFPGEELQLTFVLQRKGIYRVVFVPVSEADEPAVREYLTVKARYIADLWLPFLDGSKVAGS